MFRFSWLSFLGQLRKHLSVAPIFRIDLAEPLTQFNPKQHCRDFVRMQGLNQSCSQKL